MNIKTPVSVKYAAAFLPILFCFVFFTSPAFAQSTIEEDFEVTFDAHTFEVHTSATNVGVTEVRVEPEFFSVKILLEPTPSDGELTVNIPRALLDAKDIDDQSADGEFIIIVGSYVGDYVEVEANELERVIAISVPASTSEIEIVGNQVVPEFPFAALIMLIGMGSLIVAAKLKNNLWHASGQY